MATVTVLNGLAFDNDVNVGYDMTINRGNVVEATSTTFSYLNREGGLTTLSGSGFVYGSNTAAGPTAGRATQIVLTTDDGAREDLVRIDLSLDLGAVASDFFTDRDAFWLGVTGGDDAIDARAGTQSSSIFSNTRISADGIRVTETSQGGNDDFTIGAASGSFTGDAIRMTGEFTYTGGADTFTIGASDVRRTVTGDVNDMDGLATLVGGDDTVDALGPVNVIGDVGAMTFGGTLVGGADVVTLWNGGRAVGDAADVNDFLRQAVFTGGDDTLDAIRSLAPVELIGDAAEVIVGRLSAAPAFTFGSDTLRGGSGDDVLIGDAEFLSLDYVATAGADTITGGAGDDEIWGDALDLRGSGALVGGNDLLSGGAGNDTIRGGVGDDIVSGERDADLLFGEAGADDLFGGSGNDELFGGSGNDSLFGGSGNDALDGGTGDDELFGEAGDDVFTAGFGADLMDGGAGLDSISYAAAGSALVIDLAVSGFDRGDAADDTLVSIEGLVGSRFGDNLRGNGTANRLEGGEGDDILSGRAGGDVLLGGEGADVLRGGGGADFLIGGTGRDAASYSDANAGVRADLQAPSTNVNAAQGDSYTGIENLEGSAFADTLLGDDAPNLVRGLGGADNLFGRGGNDILRGNAGADELYGQSGNDVMGGGGGGDRLDGGAGTDTASYSDAFGGVVASLANATGNRGDAFGDSYVSIENLEGSRFGDVLTGDNGANLLLGFGGDDVVSGRGGNDVLFGGNGGDVLLGGLGADRLIGGTGRDAASYADTGVGLTASLANASANTGLAAGDTYLAIENLIGSAGGDLLVGNGAANRLEGGAGADVLDGRAGNDVLRGDAGTDVLIGSAGADFLVGGGGGDVFRYAAAGESTRAETDSILDFTQGEDLIDVSAIDANASAGGNQAFLFIGTSGFTGQAGQLRSANGTVEADTNGDRVADLVIGTNVAALDAGDFVL